MRQCQEQTLQMARQKCKQRLTTGLFEGFCDGPSQLPGANIVIYPLSHRQTSFKLRRVNQSAAKSQLHAFMLLVSRHVVTSIRQCGHRGHIDEWINLAMALRHSKVLHSGSKVYFTENSMWCKLSESNFLFCSLFIN